MDYSKISNIQFDGIDHKDAPDYCDSFILSADYEDIPMTEDQLDEINEDGCFVHDQLYTFLY